MKLVDQPDEDAHMPSTPLCGQETPKIQNTRSGHHGLTLALQDVCVSLDGKSVLKNVSALAKAGDMLAVMGPSGAGKSTMLNAIMGQVTLDSGRITLNKEVIRKSMRRKMSYVLQQDIFLANLTLRETLKFTAMLRISDKLSATEKQQRVDNVVEILDLGKCLDTPVGGLFVPGLSGGEKKRANIACELLTDPPLMLMDEPTSGLDSAIAYTMMNTMKRYTQSAGKTVVVTIHQPSSQIFHMFDNILLLADGEVTYFGQVGRVVDYFHNLGLHCSPNYNPADFLLERIKNCDEKEKATILTAAYALRDTEEWPEELRAGGGSSEKDTWKDDVTLNITVPEPSVKSNGVATVANGIKSKSLDRIDITFKPDCNGSYIKIDNIEEPETNKTTGMDYSEKWPTHFWTQYKALTMRNFVHSKKRILSKLKWAETLIMMVYCAILWWQVPRTEITVNDRKGLLFFVIVYWSFVPIFDAVTSFPEERAVVNKERQSGAYRLSAYYFAKMTSELPLLLLRPILFCSVVYWCAGLSSDPGIFFGVLGTILLTSLSAQSVGILVGATIMDLQKAITTAALFMLGSMLSGGFYQQNMKWWFAWVKYLSHVKYSLDTVMLLDIGHGGPFLCSPPNQTIYPECTVNGTTHVSSSTVLEANDVVLPIWANILVIIGFAVIYRTLAYIILRFLRNPNRR